jgi:uncharacterized glyoxalase superfamily protein PhnB
MNAIGIVAYDEAMAEGPHRQRLVRARPILAVMIHVPEAGAALDWYRQALEGRKRLRLPPPHDDTVVLDIGGVMVELVPADGKVAAGAAGSVVYLDAVDFDTMLPHLLSLGATLHRAPGDIEHGMRMCQVRDPWGHCIGLRGQTISCRRRRPALILGRCASNGRRRWADSSSPCTSPGRAARTSWSRSSAGTPACCAPRG